jgi:7-keto-8-aminopelargonate synthetase-like enzyme
LRLKNHNQNLLAQIKNNKNDKKSLKNKLELLIENEASKFSNEQIQVMENGTIIDPIHVTTKEATKSIEKRTMSDVEVKTMEYPSVFTNRNSTINKSTLVHEENHISKLNQENATSMIRENHVIITPYRHLNHKSKYLNQL